jgi:hypothetical protein
MPTNTSSPSSPQNPSHYNIPATNVQLIDVIRSASYEWSIPKWEFFLWSSMIQYAFRFHKKGTPYDDLRKCRVYLDWLIDCYSPHNGSTGERDTFVHGIEFSGCIPEDDA